MATTLSSCDDFKGLPLALRYGPATTEQMGYIVSSSVLLLRWIRERGRQRWTPPCPMPRTSGRTLPAELLQSLVSASGRFVAPLGAGICQRSSGLESSASLQRRWLRTVCGSGAHRCRTMAWSGLPQLANRLLSHLSFTSLP